MDPSTYLVKIQGKHPDAKESYAKISIKHMPKVSQHTWYLGKTGYPYAYINRRRVQLHKYIWFLNHGVYRTNTIDPITHKKTKLYIDHSNRDKLDAQDHNLRISTPAQNAYNKTSKGKIIDPMTNMPLHHIKLKKSGYQVSVSKDSNVNTIDKIGSLEEAKNIYNMMATEMFGEFAVLY